MTQLRAGLSRLDTTVDRYGSTIVVRVEGELDTYTAAAFADRVSRAPSARLLAIDLSRVDLVDGAGVRVLCAQARVGRLARRRVVLVCPDGPVRRALSVARLDEPLAIVGDARDLPSVAQAVGRTRPRTLRAGNYAAPSVVGSRSLGRGPDARSTRLPHRLVPEGDHTGRHP